MSRRAPIEAATDARQALSPEASRRYARHLLASDIGLRGQLRLLDARVVLVGAGGLGSASALYLAAAGVGTLGIVDPDVVELSNLQRQILHTTERIGVPKVYSAERAITAVNPGVDVVTYRTRIAPENVMDVLAGYDVVVDGVDDFATRYVLNEASVRLGIPMVSAATYDCEGRLSVWMPPDGPCYRCVYAAPPPSGEPSSCDGVLGVLAGVMGILQAAEVVKLLTLAGDPLVGRMLVYDALAATFTELRVPRDPACPTCSSARP